MTQGQILEPDQLQLSPPSAIPPCVNSDGMDSVGHHIMCRPGFGSTGRRISVLVNHLKVSVESSDGTFYQYAVKITSEDLPIESKHLRRNIIDKLFLTYSSKLNARRFAFDGKDNLYTVGPLPQEFSDFMLIYEESIGLSADNPDEPTKKSKHSLAQRLFKVELSYCCKIPLQSIALTSDGLNTYGTQDLLRVLNTILRQRAINKGCLLVKQSFFQDDSRNFFEVDGGVMGLRGFDSSFHMTRAGLSLNLDVAMTLILKPGPVFDFLLANQNVREARNIDWVKAKRMLKNLRVTTSHTNRVYKIIGLSGRPCYQQSFSLKFKDNDSNEEQFREITVLEYFLKHHGVVLTYSKYMPCLDVGKPNQSIYLPIEICSLISLQRYKRLLSPTQQLTLLEKTKQKPHERMKTLTDVVKNNQYENDPLLVACGISLEKQFMQIAGRVLEPPKLKVGRGQDCMPDDSRWTFKNKQFLEPVNIKCWAIVNFSCSCDTSYFSRELIKCGMSKGMDIERPYALIEENQQMKKASPLARVDAMFEKLQDKLPDQPEFILCVLPERKTSDLYGPWKMRSLCNFGLVTQCVCPVKITDRYLTNVLVKINSKLGGVNSLLAIEEPCFVPHVKNIPTMILGMDVSHGSSGGSDLPSIAAVVGSISWPLVSRYRAAVRTQSPRAEIIDSLFKPQENGADAGIMRELLKDFYVTSEGNKPKQIIVFRDGVSDSQFSQVLDIELEQIKQAYLGLGEAELPKFTVIVAQKRHHTRLFEVGVAGNVPPGTVVDTEVVHPRNYDFYMCAHGGMIGTLRPVHYHVLLDEIGFSPDELQNFIHALSYVNQRSTHATSVVAPISYAHHAARQVGQFVKFHESPENGSENNGVTSSGAVPVSVPELPSLHKNVKDTMFFC
ncbi:Protein argonaute 16 [Bienertia sinuspersici]